jgi:hypothetical protein
MQTRIGSLLTRTAADGSYAADVIPGQTYAIGFLDPRGAAPLLTEVNVQEGTPRDGLNLRMNTGALVRGRVTRGPEGKPAVHERVNIIMTHDGSRRREMVFWAMTDGDGRYAVRLTPGRYSFRPEFAGPGARAEVNVIGGEEIVRDLVAGGGIRRPSSTTFAGVVVERIGAEKRAVAGAEVRELHVGATGFAPIQAAADAQGRFVAAVGARPKVLYVRSPDGLRAGYFEVPAEGDVEVPLSKAAMLIGRAVDPDGRPVAGRRVSLVMSGGVAALARRSTFWETYTDETGGFQFLGLVPGSAGDVGVNHSNELPRPPNGPKSEVREFKVNGPEPIFLPDFVVPTDPPGK